MILSQDLRDSTGSRARSQNLLKANEVPKWSMTVLFEEVVPHSRRGGMTGKQLDQMMVDDPKRWLDLR